MSKSKEYRENFVSKNPTYEKDYSQKLRDKDPEWNKKVCAKYRAKPGFNESRRKYNREYLQRKRKEDKQVALRDNLRTRIRTSLKSSNLKKCTKTEQLIGCTVQKVKEHLESLFQPGMSWDNYGEWHVDHIKPCSLFDLTNEEEQKECFHYTNLQPLWAKDNIRKSNKYE